MHHRFFTAELPDLIVEYLAPLSFTASTNDGSREISFRPTNLVIAGWAGRDADAIEHHIQELEAIGVRRPRAVPLFYRLSASLLTTAPHIEVTGSDSSGEAEAVLIRCEDTLWVGIGSDHTDRKVETYGVTVSKQICGKPIGPQGVALRRRRAPLGSADSPIARGEWRRAQALSGRPAVEPAQSDGPRCTL
jgi:hypothetical protein